ncbi:interferon-induced protein 44-like [Scyliorhinus canicula]|uniref:interferon-induced protein 44-like n=1 Tax=Scyliorhinus canicula TaxID=7830 RepID=UPI0018F36406|nr:interferon-induced protein 44-like [Scyliorhinus canicula]
MSEITSKFTVKEWEQLAQLFDEKVNLHLLYKASVHGFDGKSFHAKCDGQGPTFTVGYNTSGYVFGGYTSEDFITDGNKKDNKAFLYRLYNAWRRAKFAVKPNAVAVCNHLEHGPNFGDSLVFLADGNKITYTSGPSYCVDEKDLFGGDVNLSECEVYRVEKLKTPWRTMTWNEPWRKQSLIQSINSYKLYRCSVPQARILLIGPVGGGKSSFINSVNSVFRGNVTNRALAGGGAINGTKMFRTYSFGNADGKSPPLILCDTMGISEGTEWGIHSDDIISIIKGHVPKRYQFNTTSPIEPDTKGYIKSATIGERIHCVVYVLDASKPTLLSPEMEKKMCTIQSQINDLEIPQVVLLTKVDEACPLVGEDVTNVYRSEHIEKKVLEVGKKLSVPVSCIFPVKNYWLDINGDDPTDMLIISAVLQMLRYADDYFQNLDD